MTFIGDETIKCVRCGNLFTWSYESQRHYRERNWDQPKHCRHCRQIRSNERRSSQMDHPRLHPIAEPLTPSPRRQKPIQKEIPLPSPEKRPSWWTEPVNRLLVIFWFLIILAVLVFLSLLVMWF
jgi:hypothetical protein